MCFSLIFPFFLMFVPHIYLLHYSQISMCKFGLWLVSNGDFVQTKDVFLCRKHSKSSYKFDENLREKIRNFANISWFRTKNCFLLSSLGLPLKTNPNKGNLMSFEQFLMVFSSKLYWLFCVFLRYFSQSLALNLLIFYEIWWLSALEKHDISMGFLNISIFYVFC